MKNNPLVICDVDITIVPSDYAWLDWLNQMSGRSETPDSLNWEYNIGKFFEKDLERYHVSPFDFWRNSVLYDTLKPYDGVYDVLNNFKTNGYDIVFCSHIKGNHHKSKYNMLQRYFGDIMDGFVATKEKQYVSSGTGKDIIIDDRFDYLNNSNAYRKFWFENDWNQFEPAANDIITLYSWEDFYLELNQ